MARPRNKTTKGFALIEGIVVAIGLVLLITALFMVLYLSFTKIWVKSALYDGLICVQEDRAVQECRRRVRDRLSYLPWGRILKIDLQEDGRAEIKIRENLTFTVQQSLPEGLK